MANNNEIERRRTFAIIAHPDAGKTSLTEKLLLFGGQIQVAGAVKSNKIKKTATSDWMDIEKQRGISVTTSVMEFDYHDYKVNILDTPGHQDFAEDTYRTLTAVDSVIIVVDGAKGVETQTRKLMEVCRMRNTPVIIFINKMDREAKDPFDLLDELEEELHIHVRPLTWPIESGVRFKGVYNIYEHNLNLYQPSKQVVTEKVEVDIHTFEEKYGDYYSQEQLAREYFVNTGTIISWIRKGKITPTVEFPFGSKKISLFSPEDVEKYRKELNIQEHNDDTVRDDFFAFLEERDYSLSYKMPFLLSFIDHMDTIGDAKIEDVLTDYIAFYQDRIDKGLPVDRPSCPYNAETLKDRKMIKSSMLTNPFEKFERKRFMYYSKDLGVISLNHALLAKMSEGDWERVKGQMREDLERYYSQT